MTHVMLAPAFARAGHFLRSHPPHHRENVRAQRIVQERPWDPPVVFGERAGMEARPTAAHTDDEKPREARNEDQEGDPTDRESRDRTRQETTQDTGADRTLDRKRPNPTGYWGTVGYRTGEHTHKQRQTVTGRAHGPGSWDSTGQDRTRHRTGADRRGLTEPNRTEPNRIEH